jgi:uncharacterized membrane protein YfbV (UPF0208 family)
MKKRNRKVAVFVGQNYLNFTPNETHISVIFKSAHEKHFIRMSVRLAKRIMQPVYVQESDCD